MFVGIKYHNDLHAFELTENCWHRVEAAKGMGKDQWPSARAGFQFSVIGDRAFVYGGTYRKQVSLVCT